MYKFLNALFLASVVAGFLSTIACVVCGLWPCPDWAWRLALTVLYISLATGIFCVVSYYLVKE